ncbi:hypothetical protein CRG98_025873 [Punica granatum]|uniref:Uncharacterized protein n=1 Tax=Punica granatum TaxID=22663 RepID=A0A2I0JCK2_PUNGR|nr:hypothetical protein CRG98_025873 [Punica granatum]
MPQGSCQAVWTRISSHWGPHACALITRLGSVHHPRGRTTDTHEKESPLPVYDLEVKGQWIGSDRIARPKEKPPGRAAGPDWSVGPIGPNFWAGPTRQGNGPRPVSQRAAGIGGSGGDEATGGGSRPWTSRRRPEWMWEMALGTAWASPWSIGASPAFK